MDVIAVQQTVHGYRDGHRLLRTSIPLDTDAMRMLLVMSDMSGPTMQPGFEEYLTAYPLSGTTLYVLAKTWYASEMKRPGCVWTQSLLIEHEDLAKIEGPSTLLGAFRRPSLEDGESSNAAPMTVPVTPGAETAGVVGPTVSVVSALYADDIRAVIVFGDTASQFEALLLQVWFQQWPKLRATFSFCTGALAPRVCNGAVLDLQVVPRSVSPSQYRKVAASATVVDPRIPASEQDPGIDIVASDIGAGIKGRFRRWLRVCAETEVSRSLVGRFARVFRFWEADQLVEPEHVVLEIAGEFQGVPTNRATVCRLLEELFSLYRNSGGVLREIELLETLAVRSESTVFDQVTTEIEQRTRDLFVTNKDACLELLRRLLASDLSSIGERVVRVLFGSVSVADALELSASKPHLLPTMVQANPALASSPDLWLRAPIDRREVLTALSNAEAIAPEVMRDIVSAIIKARVEGIAEDLFRAAGSLAIEAVLDASRSGSMELDWHWRNALTRRPEAVVTWLQHREAVSISDLALVTRLVSPNDTAVGARCSTMWASYLGKGIDQAHDTVVASFGLALGLGQPEQTQLVLAFFQPVFNALEKNALDYTAWNWIREYAPSLSWWRDWDKCERVAAAVAGRLVEDEVPPEEFFRAIRSETAVRHVVGALYAKREGRKYLDSIHRAITLDPNLGTANQRRAFQEKRW